jgi:arylsulfatase A-like enzyme
MFHERKIRARLIWKGGWRVSAMVRWPGKIPAGQWSNEIVHYMDSFPTRLATASEPDIKEDLNWVADAGAGAAQGKAGSTAFVGHASNELEALDSVSSEQVAADIETRMGKKYNWTEGVGTGVSD